jgi:ATP-binding cassette subfamily C protein LapB
MNNAHADLSSSKATADEVATLPSLPDAGADDPLLGSLLILAEQFGHSVPESSLVSGLPLVDGRLTPGLFARAAARVGLSARVIKRRLRDIPRILFPAIVLMKNGGAVVLASREGKNANVIIPESGSGTVELSLSKLEADYTGYAICVKPEYHVAELDEGTTEQEIGKKHWFWGAVLPLWRTYVQVFAAAFLINCLVIALPLFIMNVYDRVLPNKSFTTLWVLALGMGLAIIFDFLLKTLRVALLNNIGRRADLVLASRLFEHVLALDLGKRPLKTGEFANQLRDYEMVREFFTSSTVITLTDFMFIWLFIFVIYLIAGPIAWIPTIAVVAVLAVGLALQVPLLRAVHSTQTEATHRHSILFEALTGLETIKCSRAEGQFQRKWEQFIDRNAGTTERLRHISSLIMNFTSLAQQLVSVGVIIVGLYLFDAGEVTTGAIIAAVILSSRAVAPLGQIAGTLARAQQAFHSYSVLDNIMNVPEEDFGQVRHISRRINKGDISFENVTFKYPEADAPALDDLSLKIEEGERVAIIGKIGSGKTTIGRLLARLYVPSSGSLLLDGVDIRQYHPAEIRRCVSFVSQDTALFNGSVRDNIVLGTPQVSDELVVRAADLAGVTDFVRGHPQGFNMSVGEAGRFLSSGQKQAIALARSLLLGPKIIFLDEPSGSMDTASERLLIERLKSTFQSDQTVIVTTHRSSMLALVSRLIVIDRGKLIADGPRDEVLAMLTRSTHRQPSEALIKRSGQGGEARVRTAQTGDQHAKGSDSQLDTREVGQGAEQDVEPSDAH